MLNRRQTPQPSSAPSGAMEGLVHPKLHDSTYRGERTANGKCRVWIESKLPDGTINSDDLPPASGTRDNNPIGYAFGSNGGGAAQLALSLLTDALSDRELALRHYLEFKRAHVVGWPEQWSITAEEIRFFVLKQATAPPAPARFSPGAVYATPGIVEKLPPEDVSMALQRHVAGDWGDLDAHDWNANEEALRDGGRLLSAYFASNGVKFWIITEADRVSTTALLPEEY